MGLFDMLKGRPHADPEVLRKAAERQALSVRNLESGGLPVNAIERLNEQRLRQGTDKHFFTSNLSPNEFTLLRRDGYSPLGQVMGSSVYHVGYQWNRANWSNASLWGGGDSYELAVLTEAFRNARGLALSRLAQEAALLGATGVVGVRLTRKQHEWGEGLLEFAAVGTAIRESERAIPDPAAKGQRPFVSDLSAQDFWSLRQAGFRPMGIAAGNCTYYQIPNWTTQRAVGRGLFSSWQNQELGDYTQALYQARELGMTRLSHEALLVGGTGIVGVTAEVEAEPVEIDTGNNSHRTDMMYHFTAIGTVIAPAVAEVAPLPIATTVSLLDAAVKAL